MVIPSRLPEYIVAAMVIILAPGPSVLFVIARAIAWGRKTAVFTVAGNVTGAFALSTMVAIGLGPILQRSDLAYAAIQWGGGLYLMYLGIGASINFSWRSVFNSGFYFRWHMGFVSRYRSPMASH